MENMPVVKEFIELAKLDCASRHERLVVDAVTKKLKELGFTVREDGTAAKVEGEAGNVCAYLEGTAKGCVLFAAHLDRVQNGLGIKPQIKDGNLVSDGTTILAADDLSGVAAILDGIRRALASGKPHPRIEVLFSVCEEIGVQGTRHLDTSLFEAKYGFVLDSPGRVGRVLDAAMGKAELFLDIKGKAAHAAYPELGVSATHAAVQVLSRIGDGRLDEDTVINWSYLVAPGPCNAVPDTANAKAFAMSLKNEKLEAYLELFQKTAKEVAEETGAEIDAHYVLNYPAFFVPADHRPVKVACEALTSIGVEPRVEHGGGGLDANRLNGYGIECVGLSTGYSKNHTVNETLVVEDLVKSGEMVEKIIEACAE